MFVVNWEWKKGEKCYPTNRQPNRKPYTSDPLDPDCKKWKTRKAAEKWINSKTYGYAEKCVVEEI